MEIKPEQDKHRSRVRFLWLLLLANGVLIFGIWQYHRLLVEVSDGATVGLYQRLFRRGSENQLESEPLRIALLRSESTAIAFGENRDGYYHLIEMWRQFFESEGFGYRIVESVPQGDEVRNYNLLVLPATYSMQAYEREAVKRFLRSGRGVFMTWATGTRNEYGQWERYSLLSEVAGLDLATAPPSVDEKSNVSSVLLSGGYPLTANLNPGTFLRVTAYDQPVSAIVRENRTRIDGIWANAEDRTYALHSLRDRAAVVHGNYFDGRFGWMGFTIASVQQSPAQQATFLNLIRSSLFWCGQQVHAFKPVWPDNRMSMISVTQNIESEQDFRQDILDLAGRYRFALTSFVQPDLFLSHPAQVASLQRAGEVGILAPGGEDYAGVSMHKQREQMQEWLKRAESVLGESPIGLRFADENQLQDATLDAAVRAGFVYVTSPNADRLVPEPIRSYRPVKLVTRPRTLWKIPEMPYVPPRVISGLLRNPMTDQFAQISVLGGYYGLSFRPSAMNDDFLNQLEVLLQTVLQQGNAPEPIRDIVALWEGWDNIGISVRHITPERASLRISNTWTEEVKDIVINLEMPFVQEELNISTMTLGTRLPDRLQSSGVRWRLELDRLRPGGNVAYYIDVDRDMYQAQRTPVMVPGEEKMPEQPQRDVW